MKTLSRSGATFASIAVLLVISLAIMFLVGQLIIDANAKLLASQALLDRLTDTLSIVKDAETGQRGFLITGNDAYLVPYRQAQSELADQLNALRDDARHANLEEKSIDDLSQVIGKKMTELEKTIDVRRSAGLDAARAMVNTHLGKSYMEDIRVRVLGLADHARNTVRHQSERATQWEWVRTIAFTVITAVDLLFILWSYRRLRAESAAKEAAALDVLRQKNLLGVTLSSIGDAVIVTDTSATIVFMNKVAEALTGWTDGSANGQPCDAVFRIINEHSRQPVESPVDKVLKTGHTVGLANHTLLIRKDGSELPIDDSGAPVRDASGNVHGVVLIFRDFTHQREASNKLINAMRDLEAANKAKDRFVAMISHELRTPLTPVLGTLTAWEMSDTLSPDLRDEVRMLRWNVELEARLIDDLLDLTRLNAGKLSLKLETADVHQYVRSVLTIFQREIDEKQLKIDLSLAAAEHFVRCDTARLQQVIWNILKNSAKLTAMGGLIRVSTENDDGRLVLKVA
ncbi:MAG: CHASE3 domain-containing protein, partial [Tepidisphaeraceae bacterium]